MKTPRVLKGFRDILPKQAVAKAELLDILKKQFELFAYQPIETPHLEYTELLIEQSSEEISKQLYRFNDNGGRDVCLRFDLTVPFARFVIQHQNELSRPFKRYAIGNVFRGENPQFGRYREFTQCDIDLVGSDSLLAEAEIIQVMGSCLLSLNLNEFIIRINSRKLLNGLANDLNCGDRTADILRIVDKLDKIGIESVTEELKKALNLEAAQVDKIIKFINLGRGADAEWLAKLKNFSCQDPEFLRGIEEISELASYLAPIEELKGKYIFDVSIARGLGYYTGVVYETNLLALPELGSICSGGRYDNLTQQYSKEKYSGVGASFGLDRLLAGLEKMALLKSKAPAKVICFQLEPGSVDYVLLTASNLRKQGIATEVYPSMDKIKKQFQYAEKKAYEYVLLLGTKEKQVASYSLKNLLSQEQVEFSNLDNLVSFLSENSIGYYLGN